MITLFAALFVFASTIIGIVNCNAMDRGKWPNKKIGSGIYRDLKEVIQEEALVFLPAKSLLRSKVVCKGWKLQIQNLFTAHKQSLSHRAVSGFFLQPPEGLPSLICPDSSSCGVQDPTLSFLPEPVTIKSSSNGLLCCQSRARNEHHYYICNPATQQWKKLPKHNENNGPHLSAVLVFQPSLLNFEAEYKIICPFASNDFDDAIEFEIYSSKEGSWKVSGEIVFSSFKINHQSNAHANGVVYWKSDRILAYDVKNDRTQLFYSYGRGTMGTMSGKLCHAYLYHMSLNVHVLANVHADTMEMGSKSKMWEGRHVIKLDSKLTGSSTYDGVVAVTEDLVLIQSGEKLLSYEFKTEECKTLTFQYNNKMICVPYVNSLAAL